MKKNLIYFAVLLVSVLFYFNCEQDTLDRTVRPESEIFAIKVVLEDEQITTPNDDSGLNPKYSTFVNNLVVLSSTTDDNKVEKRLWFIPQPSGPGDATLNIQEINQLEPVTVSFSRANNTTNEIESEGFPIVLEETLTDGTINRAVTQIQVRSGITANFSTAGVATVNAPTNVTAASAMSMGLSSTDLLGEGQVVLEWDFGNGIYQSANGPVSTFVSNDINATFAIVFDTVTPVGGAGELVSLTVTRLYPLQSSSTVEKFITVVAGLTPNRGVGKDPIKLSASGNVIKIGYEEALANTADISGADFEVLIESDEITDAAARTKIDNITVTAVAIDPDNPNNMLLTLSSFIPSIVMDNVALTYTSTNLITVSGLPIDVFENSTVFPTGENLYALISAASFEDNTQWKDGGFFNPVSTPEMAFSTEQKLDGNSSFMYDTTSTPLSTYPNNFNLGLSILETGPIELPVDVETMYIVSFWVYVVNAQPGTSLNQFFLDYADFSTGTSPSTLLTGEWIKVQGQRNYGPSSNNQSLIRILNPDDGGTQTTSTSKLFIDQFEMRIVDDGR